MKNVLMSFAIGINFLFVANAVVAMEIESQNKWEDAGKADSTDTLITLIQESFEDASISKNLGIAFLSAADNNKSNNMKAILAYVKYNLFSYCMIYLCSCGAPPPLLHQDILTQALNSARTKRNVEALEVIYLQNDQLMLCDDPAGKFSFSTFHIEDGK